MHLGHLGHLGHLQGCGVRGRCDHEGLTMVLNTHQTLGGNGITSVSSAFHPRRIWLCPSPTSKQNKETKNGSYNKGRAHFLKPWLPVVKPFSGTCFPHLTSAMRKSKSLGTTAPTIWQCSLVTPPPECQCMLQGHGQGRTCPSKARPVTLLRNARKTT